MELLGIHTHFISLLQVTTPLIFKLIPVVMHLGILMRWFPTENSMQNEVGFITFADFAHLCSKLDLVNRHWWLVVGVVNHVFKEICIGFRFLRNVQDKLLPEV